MPYTGALVKAARYPTTDVAPGPVDPGHEAGKEEDNPNPFAGGKAGPGPDWGSPGLWVAPETTAPQSGTRPATGGHWAGDTPGLIQPRLGWVAASAVARDQITYAHSRRDASTDQQIPHVPRFQFRGQGNTVDRIEGTSGWETGLTGPLARGPNVYAQNNPPTEVYGGAGMRDGYDVVTFGQYQTPLPLERRYRIRAVAREEVHLPVDTPPITDAAPYTSWSSGTQTAAQATMRPRLWSPPSTTAMSDATMAGQADVTGSEWASDGWA